MINSQRLRAWLVALALLFAGAVMAQETEHGAPIEQADAEAAAVTLMAGILKDPASAVYVWDPVEPGWWKDGLFEGGTKHVGYLLRGTVNSKNSYGGYTGQTPVVFILRDGAVISAYVERRGRSNTRTMEKVF